MGYRVDPRSERSGWVPEQPGAAPDSLRQDRQRATPKPRPVPVPKDRHRQTSIDEVLACRCGHLPQRHRRQAGTCKQCDCTRYQLPGPTRVRRQYLPRDPGEITPASEKRMKGPFG